MLPDVAINRVGQIGSVRWVVLLILLDFLSRGNGQRLNVARLGVEGYPRELLRVEGVARQHALHHSGEPVPLQRHQLVATQSFLFCNEVRHFLRIQPHTSLPSQPSLTSVGWLVARRSACYRPATLRPTMVE